MKSALRNDYLAIAVLGLVQGLLSTFSLAPYNWPLLCWLAPWPLFYFSHRFRNRTGMLLLSGAVSSFFLCAFSFYWMFHMFGTFGGIPIVIAGLIFIPYTVLLNLKSPIFVLLLGIALRKRFRRLMPSRWFLVGLLALLTDYLTPQIFPWYWGNLVAGNIVLAQTADVLGIYGLSFLMFAVSYVLYMAARAFASALKGRGLPAFIKRPLFWKRAWPAAALLLLAFTYGFARKAQIENRQAAMPKVRVAVVSPAAPLDEASVRRITPLVLRNLIYGVMPNLVQKAAESSEGKLDLVVLPESGIPYLSADDTPFTRSRKRYSPEFELMAQLMAYNWNVDVFLNDITIRGEKDSSGRLRQKSYNSSVLYGRDGKNRGRYHKNELLAFGEYVPGVAFLRSTGLIRLVPILDRMGRFWPGEKFNLMPYGRVNADNPRRYQAPLTLPIIAGKNPRAFEGEFPPDRAFKAHGWFMPLICYEVIIPSYVRRFFNSNTGNAHGKPGGPRRNPDFLVNLTQDGWYGDTVETFQHYELGRIRSIETRRALVRSVNRGASGFVDIVGNYVQPLSGPRMTRFTERTFQVWDVPINRDAHTIYMLMGDWWILLPALLGLLWILLRVRRARAS